MELEDFEEIVDVDGVDITVGEGPHVHHGLAQPGLLQHQQHGASSLQLATTHREVFTMTFAMIVKSSRRFGGSSRM